MKNHKWVVAVLAALVVSMPVFAQSANSLQGKQFSKKQLSEMDRKLVRSVKAAREKAPKCIWCGRTITDENKYTKCPQDPDVFCCPAPKEKTCVVCGEKIRFKGQHCKAAAGYTSLCTTTLSRALKAAPNNPYFKGGDPHNDANYEKCRTCGEPITDERLGRRCPQDPDVMCLPAPKDASKNHTCYRCGKSFRPGQHCSAADYNAFCAKDAEQEKALEQEEQERQEQAAQDSYCPKCGAEYSIDELYHGVRHTCHK